MNKILLILFCLLLITSSVFAVNKYRVAIGNWNATNSWALTSGGTDYTTTPTSTDNCIFDALTPTGTHTVNTTANCLDLNFSGFTGTLAGSSGINDYNNLELGSDMSLTYTGIIYMQGTGTTHSIKTNSKAWTGSIYFNNSGTYNLIDDLNIGRNLYAVNTSKLNHNNKTVTLYFYNTSITLNVQNPSFQFYNLTIMRIGTDSSTTTTLSNDLNIANNFIINGVTDSRYRTIILSDTSGTKRKITVNGNTNGQYVDFIDINGTGTASWNLAGITGGSGNCGGNSGITFTTPQTNYFYKDTNNWSSANAWYLGSGGTGGAGRVPLCQDRAIINGDSITGTGKTITYDVPSTGSIDFTGVIYNPTLNVGNTTRFDGNLILDNNMTFLGSSGVYYFNGRDNNYILKTSGKNIGRLIYFDAYGGQYALQDNFSISNGINLRSGGFDTNDFNVTATSINGMGFSHQLYLRSSYITITGAGNVWLMYSTTYLDKGTSIIDFNATTDHVYFTGGDKNYYRVNVSITPYKNFVFTGNTNLNRFEYIQIDNNLTILFENSKTFTINNLIIDGNSTNPVRFRTNSGTTKYTLTTASPLINVDYLDVNNSTVTPSKTWFAGTHSTDSMNNTGWIFNTGYRQDFNVYDVASSASLTGIGVDCNDNNYDLTNQTSPFWQNMGGGSYSCVFSKTGYDSNTSILTVDSSKTNLISMLFADLCARTIDTDWIISSVIDCNNKAINLGTGRLKITTGGRLNLNDSNIITKGIDLNTTGMLLWLTRSFLQIG